MFIHQNQLEYILTPDQYRSEEQHRLEMERLFLPGWHLVAAKPEMPQDGDFVTLELLGHPLQIRNYGGEYHTFLNVCSHRHCQLTDKQRGNSPTLRCKYHGWEYDKSGKTGRIPDAGCFRPFDRENARLHKFRTATCGDLIFASLSESGPSLEDYLGSIYQTWEELFEIPRLHNWYWEHKFPCNWKLPVENTVETYHLPCVHEATFGGVYPGEEYQTHELNDRYSVLQYDVSEEPKLAKLQARVVKRLGGPSTNIYTHHLVHPNLVFTMTDVMLHAQVYLPVTPTTSCTRIWNFSLRGTNQSLYAALIAKIVAIHGRWMNSRIQKEDAGIFGAQQLGINATRHAGCLGTREERIYVFQHYVNEACAETLADNTFDLPHNKSDLPHTQVDLPHTRSVKKV